MAILIMTWYTLNASTNQMPARPLLKQHTIAAMGHHCTSEFASWLSISEDSWLCSQLFDYQVISIKLSRNHTADWWAIMTNHGRIMPLNACVIVYEYVIGEWPQGHH